MNNNATKQCPMNILHLSVQNKGFFCDCIVTEEEAIRNNKECWSYLKNAKEITFTKDIMDIQEGYSQ